ncbi:uncharacterized protein LOC131052732 isoform X1 [Cryptomeria japonica]|uniref:uncharacterized protein LOC131052732 isoform X1 n=1 Tax=Cryptomeria japonica TaxID=3369 RepID=UPI0027D9EA76|nr:uncharacterized protein LOC131052732 isoform X1 [Cryptomeria japonica]
MEKDGEKSVPKKEKDDEVAAPEQKEDNDAVVSEESVSKIVGEEVEPEEDDEDEDFDFDPFLQYTDEKDASSSLSSENEEGLEEEGKDQLEDVLYDENETTWLELGSDMEEDEFVGNYDDDDEDIDEDDNTEDNNEEVIGNLDESTEDQQGCSNMLGRVGVESDALVAGSNTLNSCDIPGKEEDTGNLTDKAEVELGETMDALPDLKSPRKSVIVQQRGESNDEDIEDAISKRTRARYSLADMSLDELETFLQESDEEDYFQNVDDEEEYRKFLAAVAGSLEGNNAHDQVSQNKEDDDEDDEDNDADFEIEIEEALESDDEIIIRNSRKRKHWENFSRPITRERRRQRNSIENKDRLLGLAKTPLRPLLPLTESLQTQSRSLDRKNVMIGQSGYNEVHIENSNMLTGFTAHQIGQLHCLIHEHVQLLVQVFSLCVLDPSKQHIAFETQKMLNELVDKCDEVSSWKKNPYPELCFHPPYIHPSVTESIELHPMPLLSDLSNKATNTGDTFQRDMESGWIPAISGPIQSVLDVAPIRLVRDFFNDVDLAVQESRQQHVQIGEYQSKAQREPLFPFPAYKQPHFQIGECPSQFEQEPLFPLQSIDACSKAPKKTMRGAISSGKGIVSSAHPPQKKTMAAVMVENTKRQSVALVSKNIVNVVQRFFPLFNTALFPHKPPPAATANRVLFTDAEDELLAMGLMTYNNDWKAIKERFLPSKSANQIFVRQKNRASSRAPENAIKAVRRMKTSPLTTEEKICIHEGLRVLKYDWKKVWEYCVPYRDPNLLRRQWRVALGTQKSYRTKDDATKKKRRIYEAMRRRSKALQKEGFSLVGIQGEQGQQVENDDGEENSGDDNAEDTDEAYVHEAFLADWKPYGSRLMAAIPQAPPLLGLNNHSFTLANSGSQREGSHNGRMSSVQPNNFNPSMSEIQPLHQTSGGQITHTSRLPSAVTASMQYSHQASLDYVRRPVRTQINLRPYRSRNKNKVQTVKLAPDLPTLNLPPSVRVIPQSMLMGHHCGGSQRLAIAQNKKANPPSIPVVADPRSHLQNSNDSTNRNFRADSSTVSATTTVSTSSTGLERNLSNEPNIPFNCQNYEKEMSRAHKKSRSTMNQEPKLFENEETPQMDTQANPERNETDVHMHPLLLQNSCEDSVFYQYDTHGTRAQIPFSTLRGNAHNSDFHSFFMPYQQNGTMKYPAYYPPASLNKGAALASSNADFHPLLQSNTEITEASSNVNTSLSLQQPCNSGVLSMQAPLSNCISRPLACWTEIQEQNQLQERELPITHPAGDANKMNFEKHSHTGNDMTTFTEEGKGIQEPRTKGGNSRILKQNQTFRSRKQITGENALKQTIYNSKRRKNEKNSNMQVHQPILNNSASHFHGVESVMESDPAIYMGMNHMKSSENIATSRDLNEDTHEISLKDDSLPGIVMEREELSDSEDDIGDSVQFEYEEMGDSDRDYFAFEQQSNMLDKEDNSIEFEKEEIISEGDETEDECRAGDTVPCRPAGSSGDALSVSAVVSLSMQQNFVRNRSKKSKCWDSAANSLDVKSKKKKKSCKRGVDKHQGETLHIGSRRKRRIEESQKIGDIQSRNILCCAGQMAPSTDAGIDGCSRVFENETFLKTHSDSSVIHSEMAAQRNESGALNKESSNHQGPKDTEKTTIEAAQVLTGIHQKTMDEKNAASIAAGGSQNEL